MKYTADRFAIVTLGALILWFCQDIIFTEQVPFFRDLGPYFYPLRFGLYENFRSGELPLWNRHVAMGFPLLAAFQSGAFYPPHLLLLLLPFFSACRTLFVLHFLIAGVLPGNPGRFANHKQYSNYSKDWNYINKVFHLFIGA